MTKSFNGDFLQVESDTQAADIDQLTKLTTRRRLIESLGELLQDNRSVAIPPSLLLLDLSRFKLLNDGVGPMICDKLLCLVAKRLHSVVPDAALLAPVGGSSFAILLHDGGDAEQVCNRLLNFICRSYGIDGNTITVDANIGVSIALPYENDALAVFHAAGLALRQGQQEGYNRVRYFHPSMQQKAVLNQTLENDFRAAVTSQRVELLGALESQQFELHYQPQVSLADGRITGFEALLRWKHPERGFVSPELFIPLAEETGLINLLGEWVLHRACRDASTWPLSSNGVPLRVAVNVSPLQVRNGGALLSAISGALLDTDLPVKLLEVELTETALAFEVDETLAAIQALGVALTLDDFGTGYSSLNRLHRYPFTRLKIDRSFVADLTCENDKKTMRAAEAMIQAITLLGSALGLDTIIEGIETTRQLEIARRAGCSGMQGYLVSQPVPAIDVEALIARHDFHLGKAALSSGK